MKTKHEINDIIKKYHDEGLTILWTVKLLMTEHNVSHRDAKEMVSQHELWREYVEASNAELVKTLNDMQNILD